mmetsp:Transcript_31811/g.95229  ORF Transcript_31811/g.95229 Transcript_31811/m.95229 type:complete len:147 (-) Transcript_31811:287-727(-)
MVLTRVHVFILARYAISMPSSLAGAVQRSPLFSVDDACTPRYLLRRRFRSRYVSSDSSSEDPFVSFAFASGAERRGPRPSSSSSSSSSSHHSSARRTVLSTLVKPLGCVVTLSVVTLSSLPTIRRAVISVTPPEYLSSGTGQQQQH